MAQIGSMNGYEMRGIKSETEQMSMEPALNRAQTNSAHRFSRHISCALPLQETSYICGDCGKNFDGYPCVVAHEKMHQEKSLKCPECTQSFKYERDLLRHLETHSVQRPYKCMECLRCFGKSSDLLLHQRSHQGEKPYRCPNCGQCFTHSTDLAIHQFKHTDETSATFERTSRNVPREEIKCYQCRLCDRTFTNRKLMEQHERAHKLPKLIQCPKCFKTFHKQADLAKHDERQHTGQKPHTCSTCGSTFRLRGSLTQHQKIHKNLPDSETKANSTLETLMERGASLHQQD
ncbi:zinc finger protein 501-like isoform X2 [Ambystoma mexicanum]|uniref:zinc finger protein 501-like isoform X2 n=1 Tax=Ambystoma mexicanum TaxID=8296 RepID=UPI0037E80E54